MSGKRWTEREDELVRSYRAAGVPTGEIGRTLGRTPCAVRSRAGKLRACPTAYAAGRARMDEGLAELAVRRAYLLDDPLVEEAERRSRERGWRP